MLEVCLRKFPLGHNQERRIKISNLIKKNISALILAAGKSSRMLGKNKLLEIINKEEIITIIVKETLKSNVDDIVVVTGHEEEKIKNVLQNLPVRYTKSTNYSNGMGNSISSGIKSLSKNTDGVIILLGDMPQTKFKNINILINSFNQNNNICILKYRGKTGNPVLFGSFYFNDLAKLTEDHGGKDIINNNLQRTISKEVNDSSILFDIDTPDDLNELLNR